jgi:hypothetical protein
MFLPLLMLALVVAFANCQLHGPIDDYHRDLGRKNKNFHARFSDEASVERGQWDIFHPSSRYKLKQHQGLLSSPEAWVHDLSKRYRYLDEITGDHSGGLPNERAKLAYIEMLKPFLSGAAFGSAERSVGPRKRGKHEIGLFHSNSARTRG